MWARTSTLNSDSPADIDMRRMGWKNKTRYGDSAGRDVYMRGLCNACPEGLYFSFYCDGTYSVAGRATFDAIAARISASYDAGNGGLSREEIVALVSSGVLR